MSILTEAKKAGACSDGYAWWEANHDFERCAYEHPTWYLWGVKHCKSWETNSKRLDKCAEARPWDALAYAAKLLSKERLDKCAEAEPRIALAYAAKLLSKEKINELRGKL